MEIPVERRSAPRERRVSYAVLEFGATLCGTVLIAGAAYTGLGLMAAALVLGFMLALALIFAV
ncbi:MAG: hypothetical protein M9890_08095 [Thermomicrobiales bacterium]|nr:hypothetical protein [Thermomicrobiales bacterium]